MSIPTAFSPLGSSKQSESSISGYASDGLVLWLDALHNTRAGFRAGAHTVWEDLSPMGYDITFERALNFSGSKVYCNTAGDNAAFPASENYFVQICASFYNDYTQEPTPEYSNAFSCGFFGRISSRFCINNCTAPAPHLIYCKNGTWFKLYDESGWPSIQNLHTYTLGDSLYESGLDGRVGIGLSGYGGGFTRFTNALINCRGSIHSGIENRTGAYLAAIRVYNRPLTHEEVMRNCGLDQERFNFKV